MNQSRLGHYKEGDTGVIVKLGFGSSGGDPVVLWDHSDEQHQTTRSMIKASDSPTTTTTTVRALRDGVNVAVGLPVVAVDNSSWGHDKKGSTGGHNQDQPDRSCCEV